METPKRSLQCLLRQSQNARIRLVGLVEKRLWTARANRLQRKVHTHEMHVGIQIIAMSDSGATEQEISDFVSRAQADLYQLKQTAAHFRRRVMDADQHMKRRTITQPQSASAATKVSVNHDMSKSQQRRRGFSARSPAPAEPERSHESRG